MLFGAIPIVYEENRGWSPVAATLPFLSVLVGCFIAAGTHTVSDRVHADLMPISFSHQHYLQQHHLPSLLGGVRGWQSSARDAPASDDDRIHYIPDRLLHRRVDERSGNTLVPQRPWLCVHRHEFPADLPGKSSSHLSR